MYRFPRIDSRYNERLKISTFLTFSVMLIWAVMPLQATAQHTIYAVESNSFTNTHTLLRFSSATPESIDATLPITGLPESARIQAMDFRPADGRLYAISFSVQDSQNRLYTIDTRTGVATQVGPGNTFPSPGFTIAMDFDPVKDELRVLNCASHRCPHFIVRPADGTVVAHFAEPHYAPDVGGFPYAALGIAYDNNFVGAPSTTLFAIDCVQDVLARIGGAGGDPTPNDGLLTTIGPLGTHFGDVSFDIAPDGTAFAADGNTEESRLFTIDLNTGAATAVGLIGSNHNIDAMAVAPDEPADVSVTKTDAPDPVNRCGDITYTATVLNAGPGEAKDVVLTDTIGGIASALVSVTPSQGTCNTAGFPTITCDLGELDAESSATVTTIVKPTAAGTVTSLASVASAATDPNSANNTASVTTTVTHRRERPAHTQAGKPCWFNPPR